jgi:hypothetical protein
MRRRIRVQNTGPVRSGTEAESGVIGGGRVVDHDVGAQRCANRHRQREEESQRLVRFHIRFKIAQGQSSFRRRALVNI